MVSVGEVWARTYDIDEWGIYAGQYVIVINMDADLIYYRHRSLSNDMHVTSDREVNYFKKHFVLIGGI